MTTDYRPKPDHHRQQSETGTDVAGPTTVAAGPAAQDGPSRDLLTPTQLADRWGNSVGHLANLRHQGEGLGYVKIGSRIAYRFADVVVYENAHYVATR